MKYLIKYEFVRILMLVLYGARRFLYSIFCLFLPINKKKIVFNCHQGRGMGDNPKYIAREILAQNLDFELVWLCHPDHVDKDIESKGIKVVDYTNKYKKMIELLTAKLWVESSDKTPEIRLGLTKRKKQVYINTWHGSLGIKKMYHDTDTAQIDNVYLEVFNKDISNIDYMISNCEWESNVYRSALRYGGEIKLLGHPRDDVFFEDREKYKNKVCNDLNIKTNKKIALYMPSFRDSLAIDCFALDFNRLKIVFEEKFGDEWVLLSRFHNVNLRENNSVVKKYSFEYDASYYPDAQELLASADILISDYSSCMFDFMLTRRPCFVFATDIDEYKIRRGFYYPLEETPFLIAQNNDELIKNIEKFDLNDYQNKCDEFLASRNVLEDGSASKRCVKLIKEVMNR